LQSAVGQALHNGSAMLCATRSELPGAGGVSELQPDRVAAATSSAQVATTASLSTSVIRFRFSTANLR
jgi:hypothetical protein